MTTGPNYKYELAVERGVPMPPKPRRGGLRRFIYPWTQMEIGDSFAATADRSVSVWVQVVHQNNTTQRKFEARSMGDHVRVWRTE